MKSKNLFPITLVPVLLLAASIYTYTPLPPAPEQMEQYKEIATQYNPALTGLYNELTPQERIVAYYLWRASLPGHRIFADQVHRHAVALIDLFSCLVEHQEAVRMHAKETKSHDWSDDTVDTFIQQVEQYAVYLWTNHSHYFAREHMNEKRTPARLKLDLLTPERIIHALEWVGYPNARITIETLTPSLFDEQVEPTASIPGDIENSPCNIYALHMTEQDYQSLPANKRNALNAYYGIDYADGKRTVYVKPYCVNGQYAQELTASVFWLQKAHDVAQQYPHQFDPHFTKSLAYLIQFLQNGDEELFKKHSMEWLKSNSRIDYTFGFIETYRDPKNHVGSFEADITIKAINMKHLNQLLPQLERQLPFPDEYKRTNLDDLSAIPNASVNAVLFSTGELGPLNIIAAYCLPNYADIRAEYGSKQIIYQSEKRPGEYLNPELYRTLTNRKDEVLWLETYDPEGTLTRDMWDVHVTLHETLGHGSGAWHLHTFTEGDHLTIQDTTYSIGDTIAVTNDNSNEFLGTYSAALEELRAEIIALYTSIFMFDELADAGLFKQWPATIGKEMLIDKLIISFAKTGLYRLLTQADDATTIRGAHALANTTIMNYLLDHGGLELVEETHIIDGTTYTVPGFILTDRDQALAAIKELAIRVQTIKSTADGQDCKALINTYGEAIRNPEYIKILKANRDTVSNGIKVTARIFPEFTPVIKNGEIVDIAASWPQTIAEQCLAERALALSKEW